MKLSKWVVGVALVVAGGVGASKLVSFIPLKQDLSADGQPTAGGLVVYASGFTGGSFAEGHAYVNPMYVKNTSSHSIRLVSARWRPASGSVEVRTPFAIVTPLAGGLGLSELTPELISRGVGLPTFLGPGEQAAVMFPFVPPAANKSDVPAFTFREATLDIRSGGRTGSIRLALTLDGCPRGPEALTEPDPIRCKDAA